MKLKSLDWKPSIHSLETGDGARVIEAIDQTVSGKYPARYEILGPRELIYYVDYITTREEDREEAWDNGEDYHKLGDANSLNLAKVIANHHYSQRVKELLDRLEES